MRHHLTKLLAAALLLGTPALWADSYTDAIGLFKNGGQSAQFFNKSYAYAVFPTIGKAGFVVGGAHGSGRVYVQGKYVGDATVNQLSAGLQAGAQAYSQIIFFEDRRAYEKFAKGNFEFGADVNVVAITAAAGGSIGTTGVSAEASGGMRDALTEGRYYKGVAVFTIVKGGAMYQATVAGQRFSYTPKAQLVAKRR